MKCYWCGEIIEDNATECKYCHIKIDKKVVEKYKMKPEKDKNEKNNIGMIGTVAAFLSSSIWMSTDIIMRMSIEQNFNLYFIVTVISAMIGFLCSFIGTIIAIKKKQELTWMYVVSFIVSIFWIFVYCNTLAKGTALLSIISLTAYFIVNKGTK